MPIGCQLGIAATKSEWPMRARHRLTPPSRIDRLCDEARHPLPAAILKLLDGHRNPKLSREGTASHIYLEG